MCLAGKSWSAATETCPTFVASMWDCSRSWTTHGILWKFNFKLAQYMALGIPSVCTPVGSTLEIIDHGITGFLAATSGDWVGYLEALSPMTSCAGGWEQRRRSTPSATSRSAPTRGDRGSLSVGAR